MCTFSFPLSRTSIHYLAHDISNLSNFYSLEVPDDGQSLGENTFIQTKGEAGHTFFTGTLKDFDRLDEDTVRLACEQAKDLWLGKNESFKDMTLLHNTSMPIENGDGYIQALHAIFHLRDLEDKDSIKLAYFSGEDADFLCLQYPAADHSEMEYALEIASELELKTDMSSEIRDKAILSHFTQLTEVGSMVWIARLPFRVNNNYLQKPGLNPETGEFSPYRLFIHFERDDQHDWPAEGHKCFVAFEIPINVNVERTSIIDQKPDDKTSYVADDAKRKAIMDAKKKKRGKKQGA